EGSWLLYKVGGLFSRGGPLKLPLFRKVPGYFTRWEGSFRGEVPSNSPFSGRFLATLQGGRALFEGRPPQTPPSLPEGSRLLYNTMWVGYFRGETPSNSPF